MKALRLILPLGDAQYTVMQVGAIVGREFPDQKIVDVLLNSPEDIDAARRFVAGLDDGEGPGFRSELRNGPNAVTVRDAFVVDAYELGDLGTASVIVSEAELVSLLFESENTEADS